MKKRLDSIQALRALAFMGIFLFHGGIIWGNFGGLGASVFIVLSGFLMTYSYSDRILPNSFDGCVGFALKKIKRLYPLHILTMVIILIGLVFLAAKNNEITYDYIKQMCIWTVSNIFLVQSYIPVISINVSLNGVAWYLCVCVFLYFCFPFVMKIIEKYKSIKTAYIVIPILYLIQILISFLTVNIKGFDGNFHTWITYCCPFFRLLDFSIGCNLGYIFLENSKKSINNKNDDEEKVSIIYSIFELLAFVIAPFLVWWSQGQYSSRLANTFTPTTIIFLPLSVALVYLFAKKKGIFTRCLSIKSILRLGDLSQYMFLIHFAVIFVVSKIVSFLSLGLNKYIIALIYFLLTYICAVLYEKFDKRLNK